MWSAEPSDRQVELCGIYVAHYEALYDGAYPELESTDFTEDEWQAAIDEISALRDQLQRLCG